MFCFVLRGFSSQKVRAGFLKWMRTRSDPSGRLTLPKSCLRLVSSSELQDGSPPADDSLPLLTDSSDSSRQWENFSMETYRKNLKTSVLGNTLLYAETVTSTMDLLDG